MRILVIGIITIGGLWLISHFHHYYIRCTIWNLAIDMYLVHGSFWTDLYYSEGLYDLKEGPLFVTFKVLLRFSWAENVAR